MAVKRVEVSRYDVSGDEWRTRVDERASDDGFFGLVPPGSHVSEILLNEAGARELRDRLNEYLGEAPNGRT